MYKAVGRFVFSCTSNARAVFINWDNADNRRCCNVFYIRNDPFLMNVCHYWGGGMHPTTGVSVFCLRLRSAEGVFYRNTENRGWEWYWTCVCAEIPVKRSLTTTLALQNDSNDSYQLFYTILYVSTETYSSPTEERE